MSRAKKLTNRRLRQQQYIARRRRQKQTQSHYEPLENRFLLAAAFPEFVDPNPAPGNQFGATVVTLTNGNVVITSPFDDAGGTNAGAVYLFNGSTGSLINTVRGRSANDNIGSGGVTALANGNYVINSPNWDLSSVDPNAGAITFGRGTTGVVGSTVTSTNSLTGSEANQPIGSAGITALTNGNYVISSPNFNYLWFVDVGAATFGNGTTGVTGSINTGNSLVGADDGDRVANGGVTALTNGNYVVKSTTWDVARGAATLGNGSTGITGFISASNSLVGSAPYNFVGNGVTALPGGRYVVSSPDWDNGSLTNAGAVTYAVSASGITGVVSTSNSLYGTHASDLIGSGGIRPLLGSSSGHFVVASPGWDNGSAANAGAVTFVNGSSGLIGAVSTSNSLFGTLSNDSVGSGGITALENGKYVVSSPEWSGTRGAVTLRFLPSAISGPVSTSNSLYGNLTGDRVGSGGITSLTSGHYVVSSPFWNNGSVVDAGAVTFVNSSSSGLIASVSTGNSLYGSFTSDRVGSAGVAALGNGRYVVASPNWNGSRGAATLSGPSGIVGVVSSGNSLIGSIAGDQIGSGGVTALDTSSGHYVVNSPNWDNAGSVNVGAATFGNGSTGVVGFVSAGNSLVGSTANDNVGSGGITALLNGNYAVTSPSWDNQGIVTNAGAVTFGQASGTVGAINSGNSTIGLAANTSLQGVVVNNVHANLFARFRNEPIGGRVRVGSQLDGFGTPNSAPTVSANLAAVTADEGGTATNSGTFFDADGMSSVTLTTNIGTVTQNNANGTWSWSLNAADGPSGPFTVIIDARDGQYGAVATFTYAIDNVPPSIALNGNATVDEGSPYVLNLGAVTDPGQDIITSYTIHWGDGSSDTFSGSPANTIATHTYADGPDNQTHNVTVTDEDGTFIAGSLSVQVVNIAPTIELSGNSNVDEGAEFALNLGGVFDPGDDTITQYSIDWGDGQTTGPIPGDPSTSVALHTYADGGNSYQIQVSVTDEDGVFDSAGLFFVNVDNVAPTIAISGDASVDEGSEYALNLGNLVDPGSDTITEYSIDWGDGNVETFTGSPANTMATHTYADGDNDYTVTVNVSDEDGSYVAGSHDVTVTNIAPTISLSGDASVDEGSEYALNLGSLVDPGADTITDYTIDWGDGNVDTFNGNPANTVAMHTYADGDDDYTITVSVTDEDGIHNVGSQDVHVNNVAPSGSISSVESVIEGSVFTLNISSKLGDPGEDTITGYSIYWGDGNVTHYTGSPAGTSNTHLYADGPNDYGVTVFVTDEDGTFAIGKKHAVHVKNVAPTISLSGDPAVDEGSPYTLNLGEVVDPGDDTIFQYVISWGDGHEDSFTGNPANMSAVHTYADGPNNHTINVIVYDEDGKYIAGSHNVHVLNVTPTIGLTADAEVDEGSLYTLNLGALVDPGNDTATDYTIDWGDGHFDSFSGSPAYTAAYHIYADGNNDYTITVNVTDEDGTHGAGSHDVSVTNVAPTISLSGDASVDEGSEYALNLGSLVDPGADTITEYSIDWGDGQVDTFSGNPGDTIANHTYADGPNNYSINVSVTDEDGTHLVGSVDISVNNVAPTISVSGDAEVNEGELFTLNLDSVVDPGDDTVSEYSIDWGDGNVETFVGDPSNTIATHTYATGPNVYQIVVSLTDEDGVFNDAATHVVNVLNSNTAPSTPVDNDSAPNEVEENAVNGTAIGITAFSTDPDAGDNVTYSLVDNAGGRFAIDPDSGVVTVADGSLLDYEAVTSHTITIQATDGTDWSMTQDFTINVLNQNAVISGTVFVDVDGDGLFDGGTETALDNVIVELFDGDGELLDTDETELGGVYAFIVNDEFGTYRLRETQPSGVNSLAAIVGSAGGSVLSSNEMQLTLDGDNASDYDFTEAGQSVQSGDTATIGFWQNKHGQALIKLGGVALVNWLNSNFGNIFGNTFSNGSGGDDSNEVANFYKNEFFNKKLQGTSKVDAQFMATALATFFTSSNLSGGSVATGFGFNVTETGIGTKVVNVGANGAAFGVANYTNMTIMSLLLATNDMTGADNDADASEDYSHVYDVNGDGVLDNYEKALRAMANSVYTMINEGGDL